MARNVVSAAAGRGGALAVITAVTVLIAAGCGGTSSTKQTSSGEASKAATSFYTGWPHGGTPKRGGTLTVDTLEAPSSFLPWGATSFPVPEQQIYDTLFEAMPGASETSTTLEPALVSSWSLSPDHLTYTFHLREGVQFSNGEPLTAEDVVYSVDHTEVPASQAYSFTKLWEQPIALNSTTVQLKTRKPQIALPDVLSTAYFSIVPKKLVEREGLKYFGLHPVGTGPFTFQSATAGFTKITLVRNPHYWRGGGLPYLNGVVFNQVESGNARILAVRSGAADVAQAIPYAQAEALRSTPEVKMLIGPEWGASLNAFNRDKAPLNEVSVRRALLYATPYAEIIKSIYKGIGTQANSQWGELKYYNPKVPYYPYDIAKAKELLKESSVPNGFSMTIAVVSGDTQGELLASILQSAWAQIGIHVAIQTQPATTLYANFGQQKFDFDVFPVEQGFSVLYNPDPVSLYYNSHEPGFAPPVAASTVRDIEKATESASESERQKLFGEVQYQTYWKEAIFDSIVNLVSLNLVSNHLRGYRVLSSTAVPMQLAWLES